VRPLLNPTNARVRECLCSTGICRAIVNPGAFVLDPVWASWVLIVYLCCHPEGRALLRTHPLTDVDYHTATAFEMYGRAEVTRRARLEVQQQQGKKKVPRVEEPARKAGCEAEEGPRNEGLEEQANAAASSAQRTLATKRKRGAKGAAAGSTSDSCGLLQWWFDALQCDNAAVLMSLVAHTRARAREAAAATLKKQAGSTNGVAENKVIRGISEQNAVQSAEALASSFVGRKENETPAAMSWTWNGELHLGLSRTKPEPRTTTLHACEMARGSVQPEGCQIRLAWSVASAQLAPSESEHMVLPALLERLHHAQSFKGGKGKKSAAAGERIATCAHSQAEPARVTQVSGVTRSTISFLSRVRMHPSQIRAGEALKAEMVASARPGGAARPLESSGVPAIVGVSHFPDREEPLCTPASRLAVGIAVNEEMRVWMIGKTRKNDPCKVALGHLAQAEKAKDVPAIINAEPPPLLTIVDFATEVVGDGNPVENADGTTSVDVGVGLHVCGDAAVRVPEMLAALRAEACSASSFVLQARAVLWAASSQASYVGNVRLCPQTLAPQWRVHCTPVP
jgi:hypothetical protein